MNLHPKCSHYHTVSCSGRKPRGNVQGCVGYRVCFRLRGTVLCKSCDVEIVQHAGGVFNTRGKEIEGVGKKEGIYILQFLRLLGSTCEI